MEASPSERIWRNQLALMRVDMARLAGAVVDPDTGAGWRFDLAGSMRATDALGADVDCSMKEPCP